MEPEQLFPVAWKYGIPGILALIFGWVIVKLFAKYERALKAAEAARKAADEERAEWNVEREKLRTELETGLREHSERFLQLLSDEQERNRQHEDVLRKEYTDQMESISLAAVKLSDSIAAVMNKFYDRFVGPRSGGRY